MDSVQDSVDDSVMVMVYQLVDPMVPDYKPKIIKFKTKNYKSHNYQINSITNITNLGICEIEGVIVGTLVGLALG